MRNRKLLQPFVKQLFFKRQLILIIIDLKNKYFYNEKLKVEEVPPSISSYQSAGKK